MTGPAVDVVASSGSTRVGFPDGPGARRRERAEGGLALAAVGGAATTG